MSDSRGTQMADTASHVRRPRNWSLWLGGGLVLLVLFLAVFGPGMAPRDPREHNLIIQVGDEWLTPPYAAFTPGFPLGSDNLGRDLYSWLLWSVRPTLILVVIVAALRMVLGLLIGVTAGWSDRWAGRLADSLISGALAVPALIASLIVITAIGFRLGVWAFVVGLSVTGWAETAQLVRERTRTVRGQEAVEASHALGASGAQVFLLHILPQVMPMIWMLLAFEISNTLVTTAGLGFLGYYLGGAVFTEVDDFVYQRISEMPELGQMLATAWLVLDEPWAMVAAGTVVFLIVLAFNLVGEGLQRRLNRKLGGARVLYLRAAGDVIPWLDDHIWAPAGALLRRRTFQVGAAVVLALAVGGALLWQGAQPQLGGPDGTAAVEDVPSTSAPTEAAATSEGADDGADTETVTSAYAVPGGHLYANEGYDPWRSRWLPYTGPLTTTVQWSFDIEGSFTGGPAVDAAGTLYVAARREQADPGVLYALDGDGELIWETALDADPVGSPALDAQGRVYVSDKEGLTAVLPDGTVAWRVPAPDGEPAMSGPLAVPDGPIVYKSLGGLVAMSASGELAWQAPITESMSAQMPHVGADGSTVLWEGLGFDLTSGVPVTSSLPPLPEELSLTQVVVGADGRAYFQIGVLLVPADAPVNDEDRLDPFLNLSEITWQGEDAGVAPSGRPWLVGRPTVGGMGMGFFWADADGELSSKLNVPGMRNVRVLGVDVDHTAYICGDSHQVEPSCVAMRPDAERPEWRLPFRGVDAIAGAALAPGRLYVATWEGELMAIGDASSASSEALSGILADEETGVPTFGPDPQWAAPEVPGGHPWPMPRHDAWGTLWAAFEGPQAPAERWVLEREGGFSGGPVVAADGTVYVGTPTGALLALDGAGALRWRANLPAGAVGAPALGSDGTVYVTDELANLSAFDATGELLWQYHATGTMTHTHRSGTGKVLREDVIPLDRLGPAGAGPTVAPDGTIYFTMAVETFGHEANRFFRSEVMLAVSASGESALETPLYVGSDRRPARISADGNWILWSDLQLVPTPSSPADGASVAPYAAYVMAKLEENDNSGLRTVIGADGRSYFVEKRTLSSWYLTSHSLVIDRVFEWQSEDAPGTAADGGATADGLRWLSFHNGKFIWVTPEDGVYGPVRFPLESSVVALDAEATAYGCGSSLGRAPVCMAYGFRPYGDDPQPLWEIPLGEDDTVLGAALAPGRLYVTANADRVGRLVLLSD